MNHTSESTTYMIHVRRAGKTLFAVDTPFEGNASGLVKEFVERFPTSEGYFIEVYLYKKTTHVEEFSGFDFLRPKKAKKKK